MTQQLDGAPARPMDGWDWAAILSVAGFALSSMGHLLPADTTRARETRSALAGTGQIVSGIATLVSVLGAPPVCPRCSQSRLATTDTGLGCPSCGYQAPSETFSQA